MTQMKLSLKKFVILSIICLFAASCAKPTYLVVETQFLGRKAFSVEVPFDKFRYLDSEEVDPFSVPLSLALQKALSSCKDLGIGIRNLQLIGVNYRFAKGYGRKDVFLIISFKDSESASSCIVVLTSGGDVLDGCFYNEEGDGFIRY